MVWLRQWLGLRVLKYVYNKLAMNSKVTPQESIPSPKQTIQTLIIEPTQGWGKLNLKDLWRYRDLFGFMVWRSIQSRYRQMALGPLWIIIQPLVSMVIFSVIFGTLAKLPTDGNIPYPIFTYTALLPWGFFSRAAGEASGSLVGQMKMISKVYFPRLIIPLTAIASSFVDLLFSFVILLGLMLFFGFYPDWSIFILPFYLLLAAITALAMGLWTATLMVRFRDLRFAITYGLQAWMYATPVAYTASLVPESWLWLYQLNPMYWVIEGFRWTLLGVGQAPHPYMLIPIIITCFFFVTGLFIFRRTERSIVDLL